MCTIVNEKIACYFFISFGTNSSCLMDFPIGKHIFWLDKMSVFWNIPQILQKNFQTLTYTIKQINKSQTRCQLRNTLNLQMKQEIGHRMSRKINQTFRSLFRSSWDSILFLRYRMSFRSCHMSYICLTYVVI